MVSLTKGVGDWSAVITDTVDSLGLMNGSVEWFTPGTPGTYDPATDTYTGGTPDAVIGTTVARIQHLREPRNVSNSYEWTTYRRIRVQIPYSAMMLSYTGLYPSAPDAYPSPDQYPSALVNAIEKGTRGRVIDGGKDQSLTGKVLVVESAQNSSWAALRTVECVLEGTDG
ncbi:MAG: hypothetical protein WAZ75_04890 [Candidatus Absconditicoccaceae bacterium]